MRERSWIPAALLVLLTACEQEPVPPEVPDDDHHGEVHTVDLRLKFVFQYGTHGFELGSEYTDAVGRLYKLEALRFFLTGLHVIDDDGSTLADYPDVNLLLDAANAENDFAIGPLTAAHVHQAKFHIGLPSVLNDGDPATAPAPLNEAGMHWGMGAEEGY
jgi:hypothetical protein